MKRSLMVLCALLLVFALAACGSNGQQPASTPSVSVPAYAESEEQPASNSTESREQPASNESERSAQPASGFGESSDPIQAVPSAGAGRQIQLTTPDGKVVIFKLNDSPAAAALYHQLPLSVQIDDYSTNEKIFYPPKELDTSDTPLAQGPDGTLTYYEPWGNVAIFYGECGGANGLYELGEAVSGLEYISGMTGEAQLRPAGAAYELPEPAQPESTAPLRQPQPQSATALLPQPWKRILRRPPL